MAAVKIEPLVLENEQLKNENKSLLEKLKDLKEENLMQSVYITKLEEDIKKLEREAA